MIELAKEFALDANGDPVEIAMAPNGETIVTKLPRDPRPWKSTPASAPQPWERELVGIQSVTLDAPDQRAHDERMGLRSKKYLTIIRPSDAVWMIDRLRERIAGKVVVEIGAGIGVMAVALATHAKRVYAIEADPMWSFAFARHLYTSKPANLTYILDRAENLVDTIAADIAICVTGSDEDNLRQLCGRFAPEVVMPWQDWNGGKAVVNHWPGY